MKDKLEVYKDWEDNKDTLINYVLYITNWNKEHASIYVDKCIEFTKKLNE